MSTNLATFPLHVAHEAIDKAMGKFPSSALQLIGAKCRALMVGYDRLYSDAGYEALEVERTTQARLVNIDTNMPSRTFRLAGILDVVTAKDTFRILIDHKTTSANIVDPDSSYWDQLVIEGQVSHYLLLKWLNGEKLDYALWDVMCKPSISPKKLSKTDARAAAASGEYFDRKVTDEDIESLRVDGRETLGMYEARLIHDCTIERPQRYFQRRTIPRLDSELLEYARELWEHGQEILHTRSTKRHARNSGACMLYGSPCKFLGICSGRDNPESDKWVRKECVHRELPSLDGDGRDMITNSRVRCFQMCRRKHYYKYELGIERRDEEEREALVFGTVWHKALEAWWLTKVTSQED